MAMPAVAEMTPAELIARLADAREELYGFLSDLGTDDLEPAERAAFEDWACERHAEIEAILARLGELAALVHETDGLVTPASSSQLSKNERAKVLRLARAARKLARDTLAKPDSIIAAAFKLRDVRVSVWSDPALDEAALLARAVVALTELHRAARQAWRLSNMSFSGSDAGEWVAMARRDAIRAGLRELPDSAVLAFDALVKAGRATLRPEAAQDHARRMADVTLGRIVPSTEQLLARHQAEFLRRCG
jgi:hypothetical protein